MADIKELESKLKLLQESQQKQAEEVRALKNAGAAKEEIEKAVTKLNEYKKSVEELNKKLKPSAKIEFPRDAFTQMLTQRFFVAPSFEIYGGIAGLYDLGPPGCAIKANILTLWRNHFVLYENMLEVDCTSVTPKPVLDASGHTGKFTDLMVKDSKTGACYRADHLLKQTLEKRMEDKNTTEAQKEEFNKILAVADAYSKGQMAHVYHTLKILAPETGNDLTDPEPFNLMFATSIGPTGTVPGFLRPETAQGIFVNFKRLLEFNGGKLPFAGAQIGQAFRNEIAPRSGLLRVREFTLAEIEHFVDPQNKLHPRFSLVADLTLTLFPREEQDGSGKTVEMKLGEAVKAKIIDNETLAYFIGRTYLFLLAVGIRRDRLRFRQHLRDEMAHYASDCWDAEIQNSYGWVECVGIADRSCFDLNAHAKSTGRPATAFVEFPEGPRQVLATEVKAKMGAIVKQYKLHANEISKVLANYNESQKASLKNDLGSQGHHKITLADQEFVITPDMVEVKQAEKKSMGENIVPGVIEPSFGIGRILYSLLEHSYWAREGDEQRAVLSLPAIVSPFKVSVLPLVNNPAITTHIPRITQVLNEFNISFKVDETGTTIGRRYARMDEVGIPFGITIDEKTSSEDTVTVRERDSMNQVRVHVDHLGHLLSKLVTARLTWDQVWADEAKYPHAVSSGKQEKE